MSFWAASESGDSHLLTVAQAIRVIDQTPVEPKVVRVPLFEAQGLRLAEELRADRDYPPFRKSLMDGYAVRCADVAKTPAELNCVGEIAAGQAPGRAVGVGEAIAIMTGAPLPEGADGIVPVEDVEQRVSEGGMARVLRAPVPHRYIAQAGSDCPSGKLVLPRGIVIGPAQIAVAASIGAATISAYAPPRVAVLGTGDELVNIDKQPGRTQIRNSNTPMLVALLRRLGCDATDLGVVRDEPDKIREAIARGLAYDALFVCGGMSMGEYDYVPRVLQELGVELKITKLRIKPGKPFVFGVRGDEKPDAGTVGSALADAEPRVQTETSAKADPTRTQSPVASPTFVFGLPGNPVSSFVCTVRLASRLLTRMSGGAVEERWLTGRLEAGLPANGPREFYQPAVRTVAPGAYSNRSEFASITPLGWKGSADIFTLASANVLLVRAENEPPIPKGSIVRVLEM